MASIVELDATIITLVRLIRLAAGKEMWYTCGCKRPYDTMGSNDHLTEAYFERASQTDAIGHAGTVKAKQNMLELFQRELERDELARPAKQY